MNGRQFINVVLKSDVVTLKDVVVVGYGVQKKVNLTGAVSSVSTDELEGKPISNVLEAMQGTTPGLVIQQMLLLLLFMVHVLPMVWYLLLPRKEKPVRWKSLMILCMVFSSLLHCLR